MSKKFLLHCASMNCMGAPGSLWDNYEKAWIQFLKIGLFVVFVFLVVMAFGYISYISPWNRVYITFVGGLLPLVIDKFSNIDQSSYEIDSSDHIFLAEFKRKMTSFSQKHVVDDFIDAEITETVALDPLVDLIVIIGSTPTTTDGETPKSHAQESNQGTTGTEKTVIEVENEDCEIWNHVEKNYAMGQTKTQQSTVEMQGKIQAIRTNKSDERESQQNHHVLVKEGSKHLKKSKQQGGRQTKRQGSKAVSLDESETQGRQTLQEVGGAIPINQSDEIESHESHRSDKIETQSAHHSNENESRSGVQSAEQRSLESLKKDEVINREKIDVENRERTLHTPQCDPDSNRTALKLSPNKVTKETNESNL